MSSFKSARAAAWELLPASIVMGILFGVLSYSKRPVDYFLGGRPRQYGQYLDFNKILETREQSQAEARFQEKCEAKQEQRSTVSLT